MKILHVLTDMDPKMGGVCQAVRTIVYGLTELGHSNEVVSLNDPDEPFIKNDRFLIHALGPAKGPWAYSPTLLPWLNDNLQNFDAVLVHGLWQYHGYAVSTAMRRLQKIKTGKATVPKMFVMPHGMLDPYFQKAKGRKLKAVRNVIYWALLEKKLVNGADGLLFTCEEECRLAREPFKPYTPSKELVVGLGVEEPPPYSAAMRKAFIGLCPQTESKSYVLFLSRIHEKKGTDLLVRAYIDTFNRFREEKAHFPLLVVAGPGLDSPYGKTIQELASKSELKDAILFPGMLTSDSKWGAFYGCEAFALPSHQENFGIAVVEALACKKPVLISNQINIWREISTGGGGIVNDSTARGTELSLEQWIGSSEIKKTEMQRNARLVYETTFSVSNASKRLYDAIK